MKFLATYVATVKAPPTPEHMAAIGKFAEEMKKAGVLLMTGGLQRPTRGTQLRFAGGKFSVLDGPFAETKELIDGFALLEAPSKEAAIKFTERFMRIAGDGEGELLQVFDGGEMPPEPR
jgi:hypothetical protein